MRVVRDILLVSLLLASSVWAQTSIEWVPGCVGGTGGSCPTPTPDCPKKMEFEVNADNVDLDVGWTGQGHDFKLNRNTIVTFLTHTCEAAYPNCGECHIGDVVPNERGCTSHRCEDDTSVTCAKDGDCTTGTCQYFLGSPLPLSTGGVPNCVTNQLQDRLGGTVNVDTGDAKVIFVSVSKIYNGILVDQPCPICVGDTTAGDGVRDGTCSGGARDALACDACSNYIYETYGYSSLDCPPLSGAKIGEFQIDLTSTTGTVTATISSSSPKCRAPGWGAYKCYCNTCANVADIPCALDTDCPVCDAQNCAQGVCGAKRCISGADAGKKCTNNTECASGVCSRPGQVTQVNSCSGGASDCVFNSGDTDSCDEGECGGGPFDQLCAIERFRGCFVDSDCPKAGDTCTGGGLRECFTFDGTTTGDTTVQRCGSASIPVSGVSTATFANITCDSYTTASATNSIIGLPGMQALTMPGTLTVLE